MFDVEIDFCEALGVAAVAGKVLYRHARTRRSNDFSLSLRRQESAAVGWYALVSLGNCTTLVHRKRGFALTIVNIRRLVPPPHAECSTLWLNTTRSPGSLSSATLPFAGDPFPSGPFGSLIAFMKSAFSVPSSDLYGPPFK